MCDLKDNAYHSKIVSILSERPQNQSGSERSRNQSVGKTSTKQLIGQSERSGPKKQEISGETECGTAQNNQTSNGPDPCCNSDNINKKSTGNHCFGNDVSLNTASPVTTKTGLDTNTTPVSSRVMKRTDMMRGTRINFDEKKTDTVSDTDSSIQKTVKAKPSEHCASSIVTDSEANKTAETRKKTKTNKSGETEGTVGHQHSLLKEISENEEILRKLKMVKMYRTKVGRHIWIDLRAYGQVNAIKVMLS